MMKWKWWYPLVGIVGIVAIWETAMGIKQMKEREVFYKQAEDYARNVGKPFLVVGHPKRRHGCGDVNIDIKNGCLTECPVFMQADIEKLSIFNDKQFGSVFIGHVLEHVDDIEKAFSELHRVADKVFIAYPDWYSLTAYLDPSHKWLIYSAPPKTPYLECRHLK